DPEAPTAGRLRERHSGGVVGVGHGIVFPERRLRGDTAGVVAAGQVNLAIVVTAHHLGPHGGHRQARTPGAGDDVVAAAEIDDGGVRRSLSAAEDVELVDIGGVDPEGY